MSHETGTDLRAVKVSVGSIIVNLLLSVGKLLAGILAASTAMITDAIHSASDVFSTIIVLIGMKVASKDADREHPYGHERFECVAAVILAAALFFTGGMIGYESVMALITKKWMEYKTPGVLAIAAAGVSIVAKEVMFWVTRNVAKKIDSPALRADAWHHRSDALSSIGALIGILFARNGFLFMDSVAGIVICLFIIKAAYDIFKDAIDKMVDKAGSPEFEKELVDFIDRLDGICRVDSLQTRCFGNKIYVDVEIALPCDLSLHEAHAIAEDVHEQLEAKYANIKHIMVHVNPYEDVHQLEGK